MESTTISGKRYRATVHSGNLQGNDLRAVLEAAAKKLWKESKKQIKKEKTA